MKVLDLFSGIGGFSLGLERAGMKTVAFCEIEPFCREVLKKHWQEVPIHDDIKKLNGKQYRGTIDVVCGGFPCQDLSQAGSQAGFNGSRSSLYTEMLRIVGECLPRYAIFENVTGLLSGNSGRWFARFLYDLAEIGYDAEWHCIPASFLGAPHRRDRVWIIAYPHGAIVDGLEFQKPQIADTQKSRRREHTRAVNAALPADDYTAMRTDINGVPGKLDGIRGALKAYGNSVCPAVAEFIGNAIMFNDITR